MFKTIRTQRDKLLEKAKEKVEYENKKKKR